MILLLEDDPVQALLFRSMARGAGHDFISCDNVNDALRILADSAIAACVIDLGVYRHFPAFHPHGGIEFIARARAAGEADIPIIVITASRDPDLLIPCFTAGCDDFVLKSEGVDKLVARLKAWLRVLPVPAERLDARRAAQLRKLKRGGALS